jgi:hypothetical protein
MAVDELRAPWSESAPETVTDEETVRQTVAERTAGRRSLRKSQPATEPPSGVFETLLEGEPFRTSSARVHDDFCSGSIGSTRSMPVRPIWTWWNSTVAASCGPWSSAMLTWSEPRAPFGPKPLPAETPRAGASFG